ncbi:hypothetical protein BU23DRAFT_596789 [Bimuria novae-zelandiae CBS 107.79]|uniref:Uncharacterized protein n=1 Tax=Bimuria novae-zelandiae CBS 107.79 TaxID=1447943 RepID=A0A6A5VI03_9PLEO|nr:hypothetical protein BU23DRAFT_596789 [Bimuria novae-zelandiae CBS 107.79]
MSKQLKGNKHPRSFPLKQIEYRSFLKPISLYHYPHTQQPIWHFEQALSADDAGYVGRLESPDPFIHADGAEKIHIPPGDEVPEGYTEVAHLPNVFRRGTTGRAMGCALGFRLLDEDRIEWLCFDRLIEKLLAYLTTAEGMPVFDLVGSIDRGAPGTDYKGKVGGYPEHGYWYEGLQQAVKPVLTLKTVEANRVRPVQGLVWTAAGGGVEALEGAAPHVGLENSVGPAVVSAAVANASAALSQEERDEPDEDRDGDVSISEESE